MSERQTPRQVLRDLTMAAHERVDALFSRADLGDAEGYGRFLAAQAAAFLPVEQALEAAGVADVVGDWPIRRRAALLRADMAALGIPQPSLEAEPTLDGRAQILGAAYVLEGSRLGGALLRRSVPDAFPTAFLGAAPPGAWRMFVSILDRTLANDEDARRAAQGAEAVFGLFESAARRLIQG